MPQVDKKRFMVQAGWDDVPHIPESEKKEREESYLPHERDARTKGIPSLGAGAIYQVPESEIKVSPMQIPAWWKRAYGLDVGWNKTAAAFGALDPSTDILYIISEYYRGLAEPPVHASAINLRGSWIPGVIDPNSKGRSQKDGEQLLLQYQNSGLNVSEADNGVEAGIYAMYMRLSTGRLKVFSTCPNWFSEYRLYRRDERGNVVKKMDHLMDATRYLVMSGLSVAKVVPAIEAMKNPELYGMNDQPGDGPPTRAGY